MVFKIIRSGVLWVAMSAPSWAQTPNLNYEQIQYSEWNVNCQAGDMFSPAVQTSVVLNPNQHHLFVDDRPARGFAEFVRDKSFAYCQQQKAAGKITTVPEFYIVDVGVWGPSLSGRPEGLGSNESFASIGLSMRKPQGPMIGVPNFDNKKPDPNPVTYFSNGVPRLVVALKGVEDRKAAEARQQQIAMDAQRQVEQQRLDRRNGFMSKYAVSEIVDEADVAANPFVYKDRIVGLVTSFVRMTSESDAIFANRRELMATGVPISRFRGSVNVVLALKVKGIRAIKTANGEVSLPFGEFVGAEDCGNRCFDFQR